MQQCSICLDAVDGGGPTLACGHRFHAACLARLAGANGTTPTRRGALTTCPNCRTVSRVAVTPVAAFGVGDRVDALWGQKWYPGKVDAVVDGGRGYEIAWDDGCCNEVPAARVRAAPLTVDVDAPTARDARPPALVTPRVAPPVAPPAPSPAPRAVVPRARPGGRPSPPSAPLPPATRPHVASTASAWVAVCTDLLDAVKDCTNMRGLREPLVSRGFRCGQDRTQTGNFAVTVPPDFPCYYDVVGKDYSSDRISANTLTSLRKYLERTLALAQTGGAYRTEAEYKVLQVAETVRATKTSRFTGVHWDKMFGRWHASISVRGYRVNLGDFADEEDAARAYDAAVVKYGLQGNCRYTVNFPGEAPLASVLAALPALSSPPPAQPAPASRPPGAPRRSGRAPAPKVIVDPEAPPPPIKKRGCGGKKPVEMRRIGDAAWRYFGSRTDAANAFGVSTSDVTHLINDPSIAPMHVRELFEARPPGVLQEKVIKWKLSGCTVAVTPVPVTKKPPKKPRFVPRDVEGARSKSNGKWYNYRTFPGREFDDLDAYRAAKKQRTERRAAYSAQARDNPCSHYA